MNFRGGTTLDNFEIKNLIVKLAELKKDNEQLKRVIESYQMVEEMNNDLIDALIDQNRHLHDTLNAHGCDINEECSESKQAIKVKLRKVSRDTN